jgi:hypothetical protein
MKNFKVKFKKKVDLIVGEKRSLKLIKEIILEIYSVSSEKRKELNVRVPFSKLISQLIQFMCFNLIWEILINLIK